MAYVTPSDLKKSKFITARKRSLGKGNVFTGVSLSTEGWLPSTHYRSHDWGVCIQGGMHPGGVCLQGGSASGGLGRPPSPDTWDATGYGQQLDGTHPTEMLSYSGASRRGLPLGRGVFSIWGVGQTSPRYMGCYRIRSTTGRYASNWNAFLFRWNFKKLFCS